MFFAALLTAGVWLSDASTRAGSTPEASAPIARTTSSVQWDERAAEHLLCRAGFGGTQADVKRFEALGLQGAIDSLFPDPHSYPGPEILSQSSLHGGIESPTERHASLVARREGYSVLQPDLIIPLNKFGDWWIERMLRADDPLRDRMTIFWHGHFVSSIKEVANSQAMIDQIRFLRDNALGPFEVLVHDIGRTPAMLRYLNNDTNVKDHPNENWARELMELFSLGDGNYTETDIKQSARAFTGWSQADGRFEYKRLDHDFGQKTFLGETGNLDGDLVVARILEQPACGRFLARKLIAYFEGTPPSADRVENYAQYLRENGYEIGKMLRRLFADPDFYRAEIVGTRVSAPVEYLVGASRRLGLEPPGQMILNAGDVLGQRLFWPPSVKGWEEGMAWITTASLMHRSNMIGIMLGLVDVKSLMHDDEFEPRDASMAAPMGDRDESKKTRTAGFGHLSYIQATGWQPALDLTGRMKKTGAKSDAEISERMLVDLLAVPADAETTRSVESWLASARTKASIAPGALLDDHQLAEPILRELAHLVLSLPEAQLE